jgi:hypothetical protein
MNSFVSPSVPTYTGRTMHGPVANELGQRVVANVCPAKALLPNEEQLRDIELASRPWNVLKIGHCWACLPARATVSNAPCRITRTWMSRYDRVIRKLHCMEGPPP